jgi:MtfA peptidase
MVKWPVGSRRLPIELPVWQRLVERLPFLDGFDEESQQRFRERVAEFLTAKTISGAAGLEVDDEMRLSIAAQACLPILNRSLALYDTFSEIIVYPAAFQVRRAVTDDAGVVHESDEVLSGEAMHGGPVVLSWEDVEPHDAMSNVVIHEFAHKLDMADGVADGVPPMPTPLMRRWQPALERSYDDFVDALDALEAAIPPYVDPESPAADRYYAQLALDPYAATDPSEFFAVAAEAFFVDPERLASTFPEFYRCMAEYFGTDPMQRLR